MASTPELEARLQRFVHRAGELYTLPRVAVEVLELTSEAVVDTRRLKQCIENDPALTAKLLRVVNSSIFGLSREVADLNQALALLGTKPLKLLVLGFSLPSALFRELAGDFLSRYWHHTLVKAVAARELAQFVPAISGDELFIIGLLQDLGILVLIQDIGRPYVRFVERMHAEGADLAVAERMALGFDHTEITSRLLAHWRLPASVVEAARSQSPPNLARQSTPTHCDVLHLCELLARLLVDRQPGVLLTLMQAADRFPTLGQRRLSQLIAALQEKVRQLAEVLSLDLPADRDYCDVVAEAHQRLASVASDAAGDLCERSHDSLATLEESQELAARFRAFDGADLPAAPGCAAAQRQPSGSAPARVRGETPRQASPSHTADAPRTAASPVVRGGVAIAEEDSSLLAHLSSAVVDCRQSRCPLSLLLIEIDHYDVLLSSLGVPRLADIVRRLKHACQHLEHPGLQCLPAGEARLAVVLPDCDRSEAVRLGNRVLTSCRGLAGPGGHDLRAAATVSVGAAALALPPRNFHTADLLHSADRCLSGAQSSGGNCLKSIEL